MPNFLPQVIKPQIFIPGWSEDDFIVVADEDLLPWLNITEGNNAHDVAKPMNTSSINKMRCIKISKSPLH